MDIRTATDELWTTQPHVIRSFLELQPFHERLGEEVAYTLKRTATRAGIEFGAVTYRAKTLESFCEKVARKKYANPLQDVTDFSGVRIVYLYKSDRQKLESLIENEFNIVEKVDTVEPANPEKFGYGALHYLVTLTNASSGARYDELKKLKCEVQVRTILQDGWAVIAHHLSYKQDADVPPELRRKLNALSGLFETADDQFDIVRDQRLEYAIRLKEGIAEGTQDFLEAPLNLDSLVEYFAWKFPERETVSREMMADLLEELRSLGCETLRDVDSGINRAIRAVLAMETKYLRDEEGKPMRYVAVGVARVAFYFLHRQQRLKKIVDQELQERYGEFEALIERQDSGHGE